MKITRKLYLIVAGTIACASQATVVVNRPPIGGGTYSDNSAGQFVANSFFVPGANGRLLVKKITLFAEFDFTPVSFANQSFSIGVMRDSSNLPSSLAFSGGYGMMGGVLSDRERMYEIQFPTSPVLNLGNQYWLNFTGAGAFNFGNKMKWIFSNVSGGIGLVSTSQFTGYGSPAPSNSYAMKIEGDVVLDGPAVISGRLDLQGWAGLMGTTTNIEIYQGGSLVQTLGNVPVAANGDFSTTVALSGDAELRFVSPHFLARRISPLTLGYSTVGMNIHVVNGDVDGDNEVTLNDYALLASNFGTASSVGDLDGDGEVSLVDYGILAASFGLIGDE